MAGAITIRDESCGFASFRLLVERDVELGTA